MARRANQLEELRQAVLGDRGREVEVEPTGEIRTTDDANREGQDPAAERPSKPSKLSPHTWGR